MQCKIYIEGETHLLHGTGWEHQQQSTLRRVELYERESSRWQARTSESEKLTLESGMCMQAVETTKQLWEVGNDEDKKGMSHHLFDYIVV